MIGAIDSAGSTAIVAKQPTPLRSDWGPNLIRERGIGFPYFFTGGERVGDFVALVAAYNQTIRRVGFEMRTPVVDLAARLEASDRATPYFWDEIRTNVRGRRVIIQALADAIIKTALHESESAPPNRRNRR